MTQFLPRHNGETGSGHQVTIATAATGNEHAITRTHVVDAAYEETMYRCTCGRAWQVSGAPTQEADDRHDG
jgi:hypothetical protein